LPFKTSLTFKGRVGVGMGFKKAGCVQPLFSKSFILLAFSAMSDHFLVFYAGVDNLQLRFLRVDRLCDARGESCIFFSVSFWPGGGIVAIQTLCDSMK
jgi:hypothetical protein